MNIPFYIAAFVTILSTVMVITRHNPVHALLYLIVSLLSMSVVFFLLGAPFVAILEVIIYAGAIMVLFIFVVMLLNLGEETVQQEKAWLTGKTWFGPSLLSIILLAEVSYLIYSSNSGTYAVKTVDSKVVALSLFGPYMIAVELAAMLLMAGIVGAAHIGHHKKTILHRFLQGEQKPSIVPPAEDDSRVERKQPSLTELNV
jgi:NADH-quinone oxidoreductase subunit J